MSNNTGMINNLFWKFAERISAQLVTLVVSIILARLLDPKHYGLVAIVMIFISLANVFVSDGLGSALIQKRDADNLDFYSVLYFNVMLSIIMYFVLYFVAPFITAFYGEGYELLTPVLRVLGLRLILSSINSVQHAYVSKRMIFKKFFCATLLGTIISAVVGITMAYMGFEVWALVAQYLTNTTVDTIVLGISLEKKPILKFSWQRVKRLYGFGFRILATNLLIVGYQELRALIIGKFYTSSDLAYYDQGRKFPKLIVTNVDASISAVLFPKMANEQNELSRVKSIMRNSIRFSAFLMCPLMIGLAVVAEPLVRLILTEKWLPCVKLLQLFCIVYLFQPVHSANLQAIKALGKSGTYLKLEISKKVLELIVLVMTMFINVDAIVIGMATLTTAFTFLNAYPNVKLLNYSFKEQMTDILPTIGRAIAMSLVVFVIGKLPLQPLPLLAVQIIVGIALYFILCVITKSQELKYIINLIINKTKKYED